MRRLRGLWPLWLILMTSCCSPPVETLTLSGQVRLPLSSAKAFKVEGTPILISNFDASLGKVNAASLNGSGEFSFQIDRGSLPESPQWFKLVLMHPEKGGPMLSRAVVLSRAGSGAEKLSLDSFSSLTQMAIEYQVQLDPERVPTSLSPAVLEEKLVTKGDSYLLDTAFHAAYAKYASGSTSVAPAADSELGSGAWELLFKEH